MASLLDVQALTLSPEEAREVGKIIFDVCMENGILSDTHVIETGIRHKQQIVFAGAIADSLKLAAGCTLNPGTGLALSEKFWDPVKMGSRWEHCADDMNSLLKIFKGAMKINPDFYDRIGSEEFGVIISLIEKMIKDAIPTKAWFSYKNADTIANGGIFSNTTDIQLVNMLNGLWQQIEVEINALQGNYVLISENANATYATQALPANKGIAILGEMYDKADSCLLQSPDAKFLVTRSMSNNIRATLRDKTLGAGFLETMENGRAVLKFEGYPVVVRDDWDTDIKRLFDDGARLINPHRALFTAKENIPLGTLSTDDFDTLNSFYSEYHLKNVIDVAFTLDAKFLQPKMAVAAY